MLDQWGEIWQRRSATLPSCASAQRAVGGSEQTECHCPQTRTIRHQKNARFLFYRTVLAARWSVHVPQRRGIASKDRVQINRCKPHSQKTKTETTFPTNWSQAMQRDCIASPVQPVWCGVERILGAPKSHWFANYLQHVPVFFFFSDRSFRLRRCTWQCHPSKTMVWRGAQPKRWEIDKPPAHHLVLDGSSVWFLGADALPLQTTTFSDQSALQSPFFFLHLFAWWIIFTWGSLGSTRSRRGLFPNQLWL